MATKLSSNVISKTNLREVQRKTLNALSDYLMNSAGPAGSTTMIPHENANTIYTKDGKTILENIKFVDMLENSIVNELVELAAHIVKTVGDGTTSVVVLVAEVFNKLLDIELYESKLPHEIVSDFIKVADIVKEKIALHGKEATIEDLYNIAYTSTNGDEVLSGYIKHIYDKYGKNVYINLDISNDENTIIKSYDGLTLPYGYMDAAFINNRKNHSANIRNAYTYFFKDNVDTPEMIAFFDKIIYNNIISPIMESKNVIPTVIFTPMISRDLSTTIDRLKQILYTIDKQGTTNSKPPILIITDILDDDSYQDFAKICGASMICKYINPERQKEDIEAGLAPDINTVVKWCGYAEEIISSKDNTTIINPSLMYQKDNNGNYVYDEESNPIPSDFYIGLINGVEEELQSLIDNNAKLSRITETRRRLNNLKANMVDLLIGGVTTTDRMSSKHLAEDAVFNCRSAALYGYGYGANFEALRILNTLELDTSIQYVVDILFDAYRSFTLKLYNTVEIDYNKCELLEEKSLSSDIDMPYNLRTKEFDGLVLSSIMSDQVILDSIAKIVTIMFTTNQAIVTNPVYNVYEI